MYVDTRLFRPLNENTHVYVLLLRAQPRGKVVRPFKHGPGATRATLVAERIESIGAHTQPDVPCIAPELWEGEVQCFPLASVYRVCQYIALLRILFGLLPFRVPLYELCFLMVHVIPLQTGSQRKVPYHLSRSFLVPNLVPPMAALWTCGSILVLVPIHYAIVDAGVISMVR